MDHRSYHSDVFWLVSLSYFILGAGLVLQPLASRSRATISALVVTLKTLASIAITLRVSEPLQMPRAERVAANLRLQHKLKPYEKPCTP